MIIPTKRLLITRTLLVSLLVALVPACSPFSGSTRQEGVFQPDSDGQVTLFNRLTGEKHTARLDFAVEIEGEQPLALSNAQRVTQTTTQNGWTTTFEYERFIVEQVVRPGPIPDFCEIYFRVRAKAGSFHLTRISCADVRFDRPFEEVIIHTDGSILGTPINLFLRTSRGGLVLGLAYPYQDIKRSEDQTRVSLGYEVHADFPAGEAFESEALFVGAYRFSGLGLYKPLAKVPYRFITPHPEERDLAEIRAMQAYVRTKLAYHPVPGENQFFTYVNAWWAGKPLSELRPVMDLLSKVGVPEVMTRETEYGLSYHITRCRELENLPDDYQFTIPEVARPALEYGRKVGVGLATFLNPPRAFKPEWEMRDQAGKPVMYGQIPNVCFASREAAARSLEIWDQMIKASQSTVLGFDGRVLSSFNEVDSTYFGKIGPIRCYATNHGHRPGLNAYLDYKNVQWMMAELRNRNPQAFLEVYWGVKRGMPWLMASFNGCESLYESNGHQDDRMQAWYNQNYRYLPPYQNFAQIKGYTDAEFRKNLISCLGTSSHLQVGVGLKLLERPQNQEFFKKWKKWADENHRFLNVKFDIFEQPWSTDLDGSARILEDQGYLFLFNESASDRVGRIPLSPDIGLTSGAAFDVLQIYPDERPLFTGVKAGSTIYVPVPASGASIIRIEPASRKKASPAVVWHNLPAEVRMEGRAAMIEKLSGWEGQVREIVILVNGKRPTALHVNGVSIPFQMDGPVMLAAIQFGKATDPQPLDLSSLWKNASGKTVVEVTDKAILRSDKLFGDGVFEVDMRCDFSRGGFIFRANESLETGVTAVALLTWFAGTNGNISLWHANPAKSFPIHWTLGEKLEKGATYRFRIESFGTRQAVTVIDPQSGKTLAGPLSYVVDAIEEQGIVGVRVEGGRATISRVAFAPAPATQQVSGTNTINLESLLHDAFTPRSVTKRYGQLAPPTSLPDENLINADYAKEQEKLWGGKGN